MKRCPTRGCMSALFKDEMTNCPCCGAPLVDVNGKKRLRLRPAGLTPAPAGEPFMQRTLFWFRCEGIVTDVSSKDFYTTQPEDRPFFLGRQQDDTYPQCEMVLRVESLDGKQSRNLYLYGTYLGIRVGDHIIADGTWHVTTGRYEVADLYDATVRSRIRPSRPGGLFGR